MPLNLVEAGAAAGRSKSSILRAIKRGALSATRDDTTGGWCIEEAELFRAFPPELHATNGGTSRNQHGNPTIRELAARLEAEREKNTILEGVVDDLRGRLSDSEKERRATAAQLTALLTDQRAAPSPAPARRRRWWRLGR